jgi:AraC family transcriptional regulator
MDPIEPVYQRILRVVDHINNHLDGALELSALAEVACLSAFHFHRVYAGHMGETPGDTVRRLRLHRASYALARTHEPILKIARAAGYQSVAAFNRAFAAVYDAPPVAWRKAGQREGMPSHPANLPQEKTPMDNVTIIDLPAMTAAVVTHTGPYDTLGGSFERFSALASSQNLFAACDHMIAIYLDDPNTVPAHELRSQLGMTLTQPMPVGAPLTQIYIPAGRAAFYRHVGPYAQIGPAWRRFYQDWLVPTGNIPAEVPCFELYRNDPRSTKPADLITDMYIPLE